MECDTCWADAYLIWRSGMSGSSQYEIYLKLLEERKDNPCTEGNDHEFIVECCP